MEEKSRCLTPETGADHQLSLLNPLQETAKRGAVDALEDRAAIHRALTGWRNDLSGTN